MWPEAGTEELGCNVRRTLPTCASLCSRHLPSLGLRLPARLRSEGRPAPAPSRPSGWAPCASAAHAATHSLKGRPALPPA